MEEVEQFLSGSDQEQIVVKGKIEWFHDIGSNEGGPRIFDKSRYRLSDISRCWARKEPNRHIYFLKLVQDKKGDYRYLITYIYGGVREFENQFPFFPYKREKYLVEMLAKKVKFMDQQNIALLSHLETIMIALRLRAADDDNLRLISK